MKQLVANFFSSFAGQLPCSTKDSSDAAHPQMLDSPALKTNVHSHCSQKASYHNYPEVGQ